ncbi:MAG: hypothetical protein R3Y60_02445 [bacterium]
MITVLGYALAVWVIYALLAVIIKHKYSLIITSILSMFTVIYNIISNKYEFYTVFVIGGILLLILFWDKLKVNYKKEVNDK